MCHNGQNVLINIPVTGSDDGEESRFPSDVDKDEWDEEQKVLF